MGIETIGGILLVVVAVAVKMTGLQGRKRRVKNNGKSGCPAA